MTTPHGAEGGDRTGSSSDDRGREEREVTAIDAALIRAGRDKHRREVEVNGRFFRHREEFLAAGYGTWESARHVVGFS